MIVKMWQHIFVFGILILESCSCVLGRNVTVDWTVDGVQAYTLENPLQVNQGDILKLQCNNGASDANYLVSEQQYTTCNASAGAKAVSSGPCAIAGRILTYTISQSSAEQSTTTQFESDRQYYFASFATVSSNMTECAMGLRLALYVNPPHPSTTNSMRPPTTEGTPGTGGLSSELSTTEYIIIGVVAGVLAVGLLLALLVILCVCWCKFKTRKKGSIVDDVFRDGEKGTYVHKADESTPSKNKDKPDGTGGIKVLKKSDKVKTSNGVVNGKSGVLVSKESNPPSGGGAVGSGKNSVEAASTKKPVKYGSSANGLKGEPKSGPSVTQKGKEGSSQSDSKANGVNNTRRGTSSGASRPAPPPPSGAKKHQNVTKQSSNPVGQNANKRVSSTASQNTRRNVKSNNADPSVSLPVGTNKAQDCGDLRSASVTPNQVKYSANKHSDKS